MVQKKGIWYYKCRIKGCKNNKSAKELHKCFERILNDFTVTDETTLELIRTQFKYIYSKNNDEVADNRSVLQNKIKEIDNKIKRLEERYVEEDLSKELFSKFKQKYVYEQEEFTKELANCSIEVSNLDKCLDIVINYAQNMSVLWTSSSYNDKVKIQYMIFPDGIHYNKKTNSCRTNKISFVWGYIAQLKQEVEGNKKGITDLQISYAHLVV